MGVYTFVCRSSAGAWSGKQITGDLVGDASSTYELQRKLVQAVAASDSSGGIQSSFSLVTPTSAVFQVIVGGGSGGGFGGGVSAGVATSGSGGGGGGGAAPEAPPQEEKKEEKEESDDDMGFSLFD